MCKTSNEWLIIKNKAFCIASKENLRISKTWQECKVTENGMTKHTQQSSLRKKNLNTKSPTKHIKFCKNLKKEKLKL